MCFFNLFISIPVPSGELSSIIKICAFGLFLLIFTIRFRILPISLNVAVKTNIFLSLHYISITMKNHTAIIIGGTGQFGIILSQLLLKKIQNIYNF